jgi:hypothetical protein
VVHRERIGTPFCARAERSGVFNSEKRAVNGPQNAMNGSQNANRWGIKKGASKSGRAFQQNVMATAVGLSF